jgi:hypothetical protein
VREIYAHYHAYSLEYENKWCGPKEVENWNLSLSTTFAMLVKLEPLVSDPANLIRTSPTPQRKIDARR